MLFDTVGQKVRKSFMKVTWQDILLQLNHMIRGEPAGYQVYFEFGIPCLLADPRRLETPTIPRPFRVAAAGQLSLAHKFPFRRLDPRPLYVVVFTD